MKVANKLRIPVAVAVVLAGALGGFNAWAGETRVPVLKPLKGVSFDVGTKRAVGYYQQAAGNCKVTLMLAESPDADGMSPYTASRFKVSVEPGKAARVDTAEGKSIEFFCRPAAAAMTVRTLDHVAWAPGQRS